MMPLPPGCTVGYEIRFYVKELTTDVVEWFEMIGGEVKEIKWWDSKGREQITNQVQYGRAKPSYKMQNGTGAYLIRFSGSDASTASMFLIKFIDLVEQHNMKEYQSFIY